jgi:tetratricopeptide (TPR) repeat protein
MKKIFILSLLLLILSSCWGKTENENLLLDIPSTSVEKEVILDEKYAQELLISWKYWDLVSYYENIFDENSEKEDKLLLIQAYLLRWNSYYDENNYSSRALTLLNWLENTFDVLYYKWYAYEIIQNYEEARKFYNEALNLENITLQQKSILLTQIWHTYDLEWDLFIANEYYTEAKNTWILTVNLLLNIARYNFGNGNYSEAEELFNQALWFTPDDFTKAEIFSNLSSIQIAKWGTEGINQAIEYANLWIESQADYPYNYTNLWISYYALNQLNQVLVPLEKALKLYPYSVHTAKYLWIYYYTIDEFEKAVESFKLELENSEKDITIMWNQRKWFEEQAIYDIARSYALNGDIAKSIEYLDKLLLNENNKNYYTLFLLDLWKWVYSKVIKDEIFTNAFSKYSDFYNID